MSTYTNFLLLFKNSWVQTCSDVKDGVNNYPIRSLPMTRLKEEWNNLHTDNENRMCVSFTPNPTNGKGRKQEDITSIDWIVIDTDTYSKDEIDGMLQSFYPYPDIIVESARSYHLYWNVHCNSEEMFMDIFNRLNFKFGGDEACGKINFMFRMPGFNHMKKEPYPVSIKHFDVKPHKHEEFQSLPLPDKFFMDKFDTDIEYIKQIPITDVLGRLGIQVSRNMHVMENGIPTSATVNKKGNYINRFSGLPGSGSTIDAVMAYGNKSLPEAIEWLKNEFNIKPKTIQKEIERSVSKNIDMTPSNFTWGTNMADIELPPIEKNHFILFVGESGSGKSSYTIDMAIKNAKRGNNILYLSLEMSKEQLMRMLAIKHAGISKVQWAKKDISERQRYKYDKRLDELHNLKTLKIAHCEATTKDIGDAVLEIKPDLVFVDNFDCILPGKSDKSELDRQNSVAKFFMDFTNKHGIPMVVIHHYRKAPDMKHGGDRNMHSVRGSGKIVHDADILVSGGRCPHRDDITDVEKAQFILRVEKSREWGDRTQCITYFYNGSFYDEFKGKTTLDILTEDMVMDDKKNIMVPVKEEPQITYSDELPF